MLALPSLLAHAALALVRAGTARLLLRGGTSYVGFCTPPPLAGCPALWVRCPPHRRPLLLPLSRWTCTLLRRIWTPARRHNTLRKSACIPLSNRIATDLALWTGGGVQDYPSSSLPLCGRAYDPGNHGRALSRSQVTAEARASASAHALTQPAPEGTRAPPHRLPDSTVRAQDQLGLGLFWKTLLAE